MEEDAGHSAGAELQASQNAAASAMKDQEKLGASQEPQRPSSARAGAGGSWVAPQRDTSAKILPSSRGWRQRCWQAPGLGGFQEGERLEELAGVTSTHLPLPS